MMQFPKILKGSVEDQRLDRIVAEIVGEDAERKRQEEIRGQLQMQADEAREKSH